MEILDNLEALAYELPNTKLIQNIHHVLQQAIINNETKGLNKVIEDGEFNSDMTTINFY